nr:hypothetical protein [Tanacetum cinerariifolium]
MDYQSGVRASNMELLPLTLHREGKEAIITSMAKPDVSFTYVKNDLHLLDGVFGLASKDKSSNSGGKGWRPLAPSSDRIVCLRSRGRIGMDLENSKGKWKVKVEYTESEPTSTKVCLRSRGRIGMDSENSEGKWKVKVEYTENEPTSTKFLDHNFGGRPLAANRGSMAFNTYQAFAVEKANRKRQAFHTFNFLQPMSVVHLYLANMSPAAVVAKAGDPLAPSSARIVCLRSRGRIGMDLENSEGKWKVKVEYTESEPTSTKCSGCAVKIEFMLKAI